jgi:hypothetical protein
VSIRNNEWVDFSFLVKNHINNYTIPQYGDRGEDIASDYDVKDCLRSINKYLARQGKNSRPDQDKLDLIKIAHYAQMAYTLLGEQDAHND